jgi:hypothetical protein
VPAGCAPDLAAKRYVEPLWVQDMRADGRRPPGQRTVAPIRIPAIDDRAAFADV